MLNKKVSFYSKNQEDLAKILADSKLKLSDALCFYANIYGKKTQLVSKQGIDFINEFFSFDLPFIQNEQKTEDGTVKLRLALQDKKQVETVLLPFRKRYTLCLSTQVGCAMNCQFCFTGTMGLKRNLLAQEIVGQYLCALSYLKEHGLSQIKPNIVFMGQGEPLHNWPEVLKAINIFTDQKGLALSPRQITLSTAGYLPGLKELYQFPAINLALSLHSPFEEERTKLIPINKSYPLNEVLQVMQNRTLLKKQYIIYEYLMIKDLNLKEEHADKMHSLFANTPSIFNLIPFNPYPGSKFQRPSDEEIEEFKNLLVKRKLRVMVRKTKGSEMLAACGQLKS